MSREEGTRTFSNVMMTLKMLRGPSIELCLFGSSYASTTPSTSYSDGALQDVGLKNGMDDDAGFLPWSGGPIAMIMTTMMACIGSVHKELDNRTSAVRTSYALWLCILHLGEIMGLSSMPY